MKNKLSGLIEITKKFGKSLLNANKKINVADSVNSTNSVKAVRGKQYQYLLAIIIAGLFCFVFLSKIFTSVTVSNTDKNISKDRRTNKAPNQHKIELGSAAVKGDKKWQNYLEDSIADESQKRAEVLSTLQEKIEDNKKTLELQTSREFQEVKERLSYLTSEVKQLKSENNDLHSKLDEYTNSTDKIINPLEINTTEIFESNHIQTPVSNWNHIPATSHVGGYLLGGIAVSTSINTKDNPVPLVIRLTSKGSLPKDFAVDIKDCRVLASCYGDISSERANIRAEELICENKKDGVYVSTKVVGIIYGDDGMNGIRGTIVSMGEKHLKNAVIGGVLGGIAGSAKGERGYNVTSFGAISSKKKGFGDMASDGILGGSVSAAEKLADYHIKLAENISPVILIPGGARVDIMFTKSVQIGANDVIEQIEYMRSNKKR